MAVNSFKNNFFIYYIKRRLVILMGIGDWGLGIGPNSQNPIPNPKSPIIFFIKKYKKKIIK